MTLGGMALAVGILVDDATVEIENIHRNLAMGKPLRAAILDGAQQIAMPAFVSTLCICIVFVPVVFHHRRGAVPVRAARAGRRLRDAGVLLPLAHAGADDGALPARQRGRARCARRRARRGGRRVLARPRGVRPRVRAAPRALPGRAGVGARSPGASCSSPSAASSRCRWCCRRLHRGGLLPARRRRPDPAARPGPAGTRIEETEQLFGRVEDRIRKTVPAGRDRPDAPTTSGSRWAASISRSATARRSASADGEILVALKPPARPTADYVQRAAPRSCRGEFPDGDLLLLAGGHRRARSSTSACRRRSTCRSSGANRRRTSAVARQHRRSGSHRCRARSTCTCTRSRPRPTLRVDVDRDARRTARADAARRREQRCWCRSARQRQTRAELLAQPEERRAATAWSCRRRSTGSTRSTRSEDADPRGHGGRRPAAARRTSRASTRGDDAGDRQPLQRRSRVFDVFANVQDRDLGAVAATSTGSSPTTRPKLPRGSTIDACGARWRAWTPSFAGLGRGLVFAVVLVYLLMVVNFQSWLDPFIILMALPGALAGIAVDAVPDAARRSACRR